MKAAAFQELLESVRDVGAYLRRNRKGVARIGGIWPQSGAAIRQSEVEPAGSVRLQNPHPRPR